MEGEHSSEYQRMKKENEELQRQMSMMKHQLAELRGKATQEDHPMLEGQDMAMNIERIGVGQRRSVEASQIDLNQGATVNKQIYILNSKDDGARKMMNERSQGLWDKIDGRIRNFEKGQNHYGTMKVSEMALVSDLVIPKKFKMLEFENLTEPNALETILVGSAAHWYNHLEPSMIQSWDDLARVFIIRYKYLTDLAPTRECLKTVKRMSGETFREFAQSWREKAVEVKPSMEESEISPAFLDSVEPEYFERMLPLVTEHFSKLIRVGELLDVSCKSGRIRSGKRAEAKEDQAGEQSDEEAQVGQQFDYPGSHDSYYPHPPYYPFILPPFPPANSYVNQNPYPYKWVPQPSSQFQDYPQASKKRSSSSFSSEPTIPKDQQKGYICHQEKFKFSQIPMTYTELLYQLIQQGLVEPVYVEPMLPPYPMWYDPNVQCEYHMNVQGHSTENCTSLKKKVQALIKAGLLSF
ncbi:Retrotransposon gag protein [Corchorus capsularis]|uniref:Retrotransposon gag protein n=1 Tax=Corchorus capsularis TaxID=210143 RepID=A0A1R3HCN5_COCAP|nr:Retrotransposon gag protein [Corchorus capsularis]